MSDTYGVYSNGKITIKVLYDTDVDSPRDMYDHITTMACWSRYSLGDEIDIKDPEKYVNDLVNKYLPDEYDLYQKSIPEKLEMLKKENKIVYLPLSIYDHSGITMYVGTRYDHYDGQWDCSDVGFIWIEIEKAYEEYGELKGDVNHPDIARIEKILTDEVETYDDYLTGNTYGFICYEGTEETDSCWGFYGDVDLEKDTNGLFDAAGVTKADGLEEKEDFDDIEDFLLENYPDMYKAKEEPETIMVRKVYAVG